MKPLFIIHHASLNYYFLVLFVSFVVVLFHRIGWITITYPIKELLNACIICTRFLYLFTVYYYYLWLCSLKHTHTHSTNPIELLIALVCVVEFDIISYRLTNTTYWITNVMGTVKRGFLKSWLDTFGHCLARQVLIKTFVRRICRTLLQCLLAINLHTHF